MIEDTKLEDVVYGRQTTVIVNGKAVSRYYPLKYCHYIECGKQLLAKPLETGPRAGLLPSNSQFVKQKYCNMECRNNDQLKTRIAKTARANKRKGKQRLWADWSNVIDQFLCLQPRPNR